MLIFAQSSQDSLGQAHWWDAASTVLIFAIIAAVVAWLAWLDRRGGDR